MMNVPLHKLYAAIGIVAISVAAYFYIGYLRGKVDRLQGELAAAEAIIHQHEKNKKITEEVSNEYQNNIASLNAELERVRDIQADCIPVTFTARGNYAAASEEELPEGNALRSDWLYDYAGRAERTRIKLIACQKFINRTWDRLNE